MLCGGGLGAVTAGVLFLAWGYLDRPGIHEPVKTAVDVLSFVVPVLFLAGLVGLYARYKGREGQLGKAGMIMGLVGAVLGASRGLVNVSVPTWYSHEALRAWMGLLAVWAPALFAGLLVAGVGAVLRGTMRRVGGLLLAMGTCGWVYYSTDTGAVFEARSVHVGFGLLFSLGWVVLGLTLLARGARQA
jgi:hypothetical protein